MVGSETMAALAKLGAATVHEAQGQSGALDSAIKPIDPTRRVAGRALTVDTRPDDNLMIHYAITKAKKGDVLVVDAKGFAEGGPWGDSLTEAAMAAGINGLIIDGMVRDADVILQMGFPVFSRGLSIKGTNKAQPGRVNATIVCGGVVVNPGDFVFGDRDGVVVVQADQADAVLEAAEAREAKEEAMRADIRAGKTTVELLGLGEKLKVMGFD